MYNGYKLSVVSRNMLVEMYHPEYPDFIGHHITESFGIKDGTVPPQPKTVEIVGYINDGIGIEGFVVSIDGNVNRPSGGKYHITWSIDKSKGVRPVHTNDKVDEAKPVGPIGIKVTAAYFG